VGPWNTRFGAPSGQAEQLETLSLGDQHLARELRIVFENSFLALEFFRGGLNLARDVDCAGDERVLPGVAPFQVQVNSFQEYLPLVDASIVAGCHAPSSTRTSTDFSGVPSFSTTPKTLCRRPSRVTRAMKDFNCMRVMAVSFHFISPSIISPFKVRYQRAWYLPRYCSS
jgi:hypothetical protein